MSEARPDRVPSTFVISYTPFGDDGSLDENRIRRHLRRFAEAGLGAYVCGSGSGEAYTLDEGEMQQLLEVSVDELSGRVPVRAMGTEPRTAKQMQRFVAMATEAGVDAVQVYSLDAGHGTVVAPAELEWYYNEVLSSTHIPVVLSTHVSVGYLQPVDLLAKMVDRYQHVIGVNCTTPDVMYIARLVDALPTHVDVHVGGPSLALDALALGANGYLSSEGNIAPRLCQSLITAYAAGDLAATVDAYRRIMRLFTANMSVEFVTAGRAELELLGCSAGPPRAPRARLTDPAALERLASVLDELDIRGVEQIGVPSAE
ncbi:MAG: dihydrodipicolinate synthase family protein [Acidimicrobiia bacterium]